MASISAAAAPTRPCRPAGPGRARDLADGESGRGRRHLLIEGGLPARLGFARGNTAVEANWTPEVAASITPWLTSDAPKVFSDAKLQVKALRRAGVQLGGLAFDTIVAGWLLRPSFPDKTLAHLVDRYLDEKLPEANPTQLVPETEGATPGQLSWFTLRVAAALRTELRRVCPRCWPTSSCRPC